MNHYKNVASCTLQTRSLQCNANAIDFINTCKQRILIMSRILREFIY